MEKSRRTILESSTAGIKDTLKDASCLFNLVAHQFDRWKLGRRMNKHRQRDRTISHAKTPIDTAGISEEDSVMRCLISNFLNDCAAAGARFLIVHNGNTRVEACAQRVGAKTLDLNPSFRAALDSGRIHRIVFPTDAHWNESGHVIAGEAISHHLIGTRRIAVGDDSIESATK